MKTLGNIIWFLFGGLIMGLLFFVVGALWCLTIIGIPFGLQHFKIAGLALAPVGMTIVPKGTMPQRGGL